MPVLFALAAAGVYGAADFLGGFASRRNAAGTVVLLSQLFGAFLLVACYAVAPSPVTGLDWQAGAFAGCAGAAAIVALYAALAVGRMGVVSPVNAVVGASVPIVFGFAFGDRPSLFAYAGVLCALVAVVLVSLDARTGKLSLKEPGVVLAVLSGIAIGLLYVALGGAHGGAGFGRLAVTRVVSLVVLSAYVLARREPLRPAPLTLRFIAPAGVLDMAANVLYVVAAHGGLLSLVAVVTSLYPVSTVLLALFLKETLSAVQWTGVACAIGGVVLVAL